MRKREKLWNHFLFYLVTTLLLLTISANIVLWGLGNLTQEDNLKSVFSRTDSEFNSFYNTQYNCSFAHCLIKGEYGVILSKQGHDFMQRTKLLMLFGSAILFVLFIIHSPSLSSAIFHTGAIMTSFGTLVFVFAIIPKYLSFFSGFIDTQKLFSLFLDPLRTTLFTLFVVGVSAMITGIILKIKIIYTDKGSKKT